MRKRIFNSLLMVALMIATVGAVSSCKDYDDDINNLKQLINSQSQTLEACKQNCEQQRETLKSQLEKKITQLESELNSLKEASLSADQVNEVLSSIVELEGQVAQIETDIETLDGQIVKINEALAGKVDQSEYDAFVSAINTSLATVDESLATLDGGIKTNAAAIEAMQKDIEGQQKVLENYETRIKALEEKIQNVNVDEVKNLLNEKISEINSSINKMKEELEAADDKLEKAIKANSDAIKTNSDAISDNADAIAQLKKDQQTLSERIDQLSSIVDGIQQEVNALNVYVKSTLRSLVFDPDLYYWGVEGTSLDVLTYRSYTLVPALNNDAWNFKEGYNKAGKDATDKYQKMNWGYVNEDKETEYARVDSADRDETHNRFKYTNKTSTMNFIAKYHLNPSNADIDDALENWETRINIVSEDDDFLRATSNGAPCKLAISEQPYYNTVNGVKDGQLYIPMKVGNPDKIKSVTNDQQITVFATEITIQSKNGSDQDTTITSDYATLIRRDIQDVRLAHTLKGALIEGTTAYSANNTVMANNTHCGACDLNNAADDLNKNHNHLMATVHEANNFYETLYNGGTTFAGQDQCYWNSRINLNELVETHYTDVAGNHIVASDKFMEANGLHYVFELTGLWRGDNETSESAHAAIKKNDDGTYTFQPQRPDYPADNIGRGHDYVEEDSFTTSQDLKVSTQSRQQIGRTPVVRVALVNSKNEVLDYGYILIQITDPGEAPVEVEYTMVDYTGADSTWVNYGDCCESYGDYIFENTWVQTEYDIYGVAAELGVSRAQFSSIYGNDLYVVDGEVVQFYKDKDGIMRECDDAHKAVGVVEHDDDTGATHEQETSVIRWNVSWANVKSILVTDKNKKKDKDGNVYYEMASGAFETYVMYKSKVAGYPDIYIHLTAGKLIYKDYVPYISGLDWDAIKIKNYWYDWSSVDNTKEQGNLEMHTQTLSPEDEWSEKADSLNNRFSNVFVGNDLTAKNVIVNDSLRNIGKNLGIYENSKLILDLVFDPKAFKSKEEGGNKNAVWKGILEGVVTDFIMSVSEDGKTLYAKKKGDTDASRQVVATIDAFDKDNMTANEQQIHFEHGVYAEALLNYKAHNEMDDNTLAAYVIANAYAICYDCQGNEKMLKVEIKEQKPLVVRFLRPISVQSSDFNFKDAAPELQAKKLSDLFKYIDWRNVWNSKTGWGEVGDSSYFKYYDITMIVPVGVENTTDSVRLSSLNTTMTTMNQKDNDTYVQMNKVSKEVELYYKNDSIFYKNLSSTVQPFNVKIPVAIYYIWGDHTPIYTDLIIHIGSTQGGSARRND